MKTKATKSKLTSLTKKRIVTTLILIWLFFLFIVTPIFSTIYKTNNKFDFIIGAKAFPESEIIAEIEKQMLEKHIKGIKVKIKGAIISSRASLLLNKSYIDTIPEYTGTIFSDYWSSVPESYRIEDIYKWSFSEYETNKKLFHTTKDLVFINSPSCSGLCFENDYDIVTLKEKESTFSTDFLSKPSSIIMDSSFANSDIGLSFIYDKIVNNPIGKTNGLRAKKMMEELGWKIILSDSIYFRYKMLENKTALYSIGYSTDGQLFNKEKYSSLSSYNNPAIKLKDFFPTYSAGIVGNINAKKEIKGIKIEDILSKIKITNKEMIKMNYETSFNKKLPKDIAQEFLKGKNYWL
jgi:glycine betaine/choline ABC-type transport system substrate-binding protein